MNKLKYYCKGCQYNRENECKRLICCLDDAKEPINNIIKTMAQNIGLICKENHDKIIINEIRPANIKFPNYGLSDYFMDMECEILEEADKHFL